MNTDQWAAPWPNTQGRNERIRNAIKAGRTWIVRDDARPAATPWTPEPGVQPLLCSGERFRELLRKGEFDHALHMAALLMALVKGKLPASFLVDA